MLADATARCPSDEQVEPGDEDDPVRPQVILRSGRGTIRQRVVRHLVARFQLADGFHLYREPVPEGLVVHEPLLPATHPLHLERLGIDGRFSRGWLADPESPRVGPA